MLRSFLLVSCVFILSGCGSAYISPDVAAKDDGSVQIVPLTVSSVSSANAQSYRPKQLPAAFFQTAGSGSGLRGAGALPEAVNTEQRRPGALETRLPPQQPRSSYRIGVGDVLLLATKSQSDSVSQLSGLLAAQNSRQGYTVQDDGAIAIPDVGRVVMAGLSLEEAEDAVFRALVDAQINPTFSLEVAEFNSQRISVGGAVSKPVVVPITLTGLTLTEAISAAGGISAKDRDFATIRLYRDGSLYQIPLKEYLRRADLQKTPLLAGDSLFVDTEFELERAQSYFREQITLLDLRQRARAQALSELETEISLQRAALSEARGNFDLRMQLDAVDRDYVYLMGEVNTPSRFALPFGRQATLADALFSEGGFNTETGNPSQIYVLRAQDKSGATVNAWHLDAKNVVNMVVATRMQMRPNDIVFIAEQPVTRWNRVMRQIIPSLLTSGVAATRG